jgi:hypothetical protein
MGRQQLLLIHCLLLLGPLALDMLAQPAVANEASPAPQPPAEAAATPAEVSDIAGSTAGLATAGSSEAAAAAEAPTTVTSDPAGQVEVAPATLGSYLHPRHQVTYVAELGWAALLAGASVTPSPGKLICHLV